MKFPIARSTGAPLFVAIGIDAGNGDHVAQELDRVDHLVTGERRQFGLCFASIRPVVRVPIRFADPI